MARIRKSASAKPGLCRLRHGSVKRVLSGKALTAVMQASACRDIDIEPTRLPMPIRNVPSLKRP
jgi:hypothetical protein